MNRNTPEFESRMIMTIPPDSVLHIGADCLSFSRIASMNDQPLSESERDHLAGCAACQNRKKVIERASQSEPENEEQLPQLDENFLRYMVSGLESGRIWLGETDPAGILDRWKVWNNLSNALLIPSGLKQHRKTLEMVAERYCQAGTILKTLGVPLDADTVERLVRHGLEQLSDRKLASLFWNLAGLEQIVKSLRHQAEHEPEIFDNGWWLEHCVLPEPGDEDLQDDGAWRVQAIPAKVAAEDSATPEWVGEIPPDAWRTDSGIGIACSVDRINVTVKRSEAEGHDPGVLVRLQDAAFPERPVKYLVEWYSSTNTLLASREQATPRKLSLVVVPRDDFERLPRAGDRIRIELSWADGSYCETDFILGERVVEPVSNFDPLERVEGPAHWTLAFAESNEMDHTRLAAADTGPKRIVHVVLSDGLEITGEVKSSATSEHPSVIWTTGDRDCLRKDYELVVTEEGSKQVLISQPVRFTTDPALPGRFESRIDLNSDIVAGRRIDLRMVPRLEAAPQVLSTQAHQDDSARTKVGQIVSEFRACNYVEALNIAWQQAYWAPVFEYLEAKKLDLSELVLLACGQLADLSSDPKNQQGPIGDLLRPSHRTDELPDCPALLAGRKGEPTEVIKAKKETIEALLHLARLVRELKAENPELLKALPKTFTGTRLLPPQIADLVSLWNEGVSRPPRSLQSIYVVLVIDSAEGKSGRVARLQLETVQGGTGRLYPHTDMAMWYRDEDFLRAEKDAFESALAYLGSEARTTVANLDVRWSLHFEDGRPATNVISGPSAGLAFALGLTRTIAEVLYLDAEARKSPVDNVAQMVRDLDLESVGASALIHSDGSFEPVGWMWQKTDSTLVDWISRGLIKTVVVHTDQEAVGKNVPVVRASSLKDAVERISKTGPRNSIRSALKEQYESIGLPEAISGVSGWNLFQPPQVRKIPRTTEEARETGQDVQPIALTEVWCSKTASSSEDGPPRFLILGHSGTGKTTALRHIGKELVNAMLPTKGPLLPVVVRLRDWLRRDQAIPDLADELSDRFTHCWENSSLRPDFDRWLRHGEILLLLDGYDEIADSEASIEALRVALNERYPKCPAIVSSWWSPKDSGLDLKWDQYALTGLTRDQIKTFVDTMPFRSVETREMVQSLIDGSAEIQALAAVPLMLTLLCIVADDATDSGEIARSEWDLFEQVINRLIRRPNDRVRRVAYPAGAEPTAAEKTRFIECLALGLMAQSVPTDRCDEGWLVDFFRNRAIENHYESNPQAQELAKALIFEFVARGLLLREGDSEIYRMPHPAVQHFQAARWICRRVQQGGENPWNISPGVGSGHKSLRALLRDHISFSREKGDQAEQSEDGKGAKTSSWEIIRDWLFIKIGAQHGLLAEIMGRTQDPGPGRMRVADLILPDDAWGAFAPFRVGRISIPTLRLVGGDGRLRYRYPDGIEVRDNPEKSFLLDDLPDDLRLGANERIEQERIEAHKRKAVYENRPMVRFDSYSHGLREDDDAPWPLIIDTSRTEFFAMRMTNNSIARRLLDGQTVRAKYGAEPDDMQNSLLANPIATNLSVVTADNFILVARRGNRVATNPGGWAPAVSGTGNPDFDCDPDGRYNPFRTAAREAFEEATAPYEPRLEDITFFGVARTMHMMFPFLFGELRVPLESHQLVSMTPGDNWEVGSLEAIPFTVKDVTEWILKWYQRLLIGNIPGGGVYSAIFSLLQSLHYEYPDEWLDVVDRLGKHTDLPSH